MDKKTNVYELIWESYSLFRNNLKQFLYIGLIIALTSLITSSIIYLIDISGIKGEILKDILSIGTYLVAAYYYIRFNIVLLLAIKSRYDLIDFDFKQSFIFSRIIVWRYIYACLMLGVYLIIPLLLVSVAFIFLNDILSKLMSIIIAIPIAVYFLKLYGLSPLVAIFDKDESNPLGYAKSLIQFDQKLVLHTFIAIIIFQVIIYSIQSIGDDKQLNFFQNFLDYFFEAILTLFSTPFIMGLLVILYTRLVQHKIVSEKNI